MDRKGVLVLLAIGALTLGVIGFLAIPPHSTHNHTPGTPATPGCGPGPLAVFCAGEPATDTTDTCRTFDTAGDCGPQFWLRAGIFSAGAFGAVILLFLAFQPSVGGPKPTGERAVGFGPSPVPQSRMTVSGTKACPDCAEEVRSAARKCRFCGHMFSEQAPSSAY
jgi:hypothetical protein